MIFGAIAVPVTALLLISGTPNIQCPKVNPPNIEVIFDNAAPKYFYNKDTAALGRIETDSVFSHAANEIVTTGGITESSINTGVSMSHKTWSWDGLAKGCLWVDTINVTITYTPIVYIAKDFNNKPCRRKLTTEHELRHVNVDVLTIKEYIPRIKSAVSRVASGLGVYHPTPLKKLKPLPKKYLNMLQAAVSKETDMLTATRSARQQLVDTRREYLRLGRMCKHER